MNLYRKVANGGWNEMAGEVGRGRWGLPNKLSKRARKKVRTEMRLAKRRETRVAMREALD